MAETVGQIIYFCGACDMYFKSEVNPLFCPVCKTAHYVRGPITGQQYLDEMAEARENGTY